MRKNVLIALIAAVALLGATAASAYTVTVALNAGSTSIANGYVDNGDGTFNANFTAGDVIALDIFVENETAENIQAAFTSLAVDPGLLSFLGGGFSGNILVGTCSGFGCTAPSLAPVGSPAIKSNSPFQTGGTGDNWIQIVQHTSNSGTSGTGAPGGDYAGIIGLQYAGAGGADFISLVPTFENGDAVSGTGGAIAAQNYSGIVFNVPEPGTALLMGLGLMGLGAAGRRK